MFNLGQIATAVQNNCHISDAQYAGDYTLCVFLLKMREFYRWENQLSFSAALPREEIGRWMQEREQLWEQIESSGFDSIALADRQFGPFDAEEINRAIVPQGYVYSAGYGRFNKPHFFLGALERHEVRDGVTIYVSSCEYARDLVAPPAMSQGNVIFLRQESLRRFLWERIEEWRWNRGNEIMERALNAYGIKDDSTDALDRMTANETESVLLHEMGEARVETLLGDAWPRMLVDLSRTKAEIAVRAVRDLLADCLSTLPGLLARNDRAAIHFYFANFGGLRRHIYPEALDNYRNWNTSGDDRLLETLAKDGAERWLATAQEFLLLHGRDRFTAARGIEAWLDNPPACQILSAG